MTIDDLQHSTLYIYSVDVTRTLLYLQVYMTIDNLHERRSGCSSIRLAPNISLLAKIQGLCNFITDVGALRAPAADFRHEKMHTVKSYPVAPLSARSRQSVAIVV